MSHTNAEPTRTTEEKDQQKTMSRRDFMKAAGVVAGSLALAACAPDGTGASPNIASTRKEYDWSNPDFIDNPKLIEGKDLVQLRSIVNQAPDLILQQVNTKGTILHATRNFWPELQTIDAEAWKRSTETALLTMRDLIQAYSDIDTYYRSDTGNRPFTRNDVYHRAKDMILADYQEVASYLYYVATSVQRAQKEPETFKFADIIPDDGIPANYDPILLDNPDLNSLSVGKQWNEFNRYGGALDVGSYIQSQLLQDVLGGGQKMAKLYETTNFHRPDAELTDQVIPRDSSGRPLPVIFENDKTIPDPYFQQIKQTFSEVANALGLDRLVRSFQFSILADEHNVQGRYSQIYEGTQTGRTVQIHLATVERAATYAQDLFFKIQHEIHESMHALDDLLEYLLPIKNGNDKDQITEYYSRRAERSLLLSMFDTSKDLQTLFGLPTPSSEKSTARDISLNALTLFPKQLFGAEYGGDSLGIVNDMYMQLSVLWGDWHGLVRPAEQSPINRLLVPMNPSIDPQTAYSKETFKSYFDQVIRPQLNTEKTPPLLQIEGLFLQKLNDVMNIDPYTFDSFAIDENTPQTVDSYMRNILSPTIFYQMVVHDTATILQALEAEPKAQLIRNSLARMANEFQQEKTAYHTELFAQVLAFALKTRVPYSGDDGLPLFRLSDPNPEFPNMITTVLKFFDSATSELRATGLARFQERLKKVFARA